MGPVARAPDILLVTIFPLTGNPDCIRIAWRGTGATLDRLWRLRKIDPPVVHLRRSPESRRVHPGSVLLHPFPRLPRSAGRNIAPEAANPEEVVFVLVPLPVSRDPFDVLTVRLRFRRKFRDGLW